MNVKVELKQYQKIEEIEEIALEITGEGQFFEDDNQVNCKFTNAEAGQGIITYFKGEDLLEFRSYTDSSQLQLQLVQGGIGEALLRTLYGNIIWQTQLLKNEFKHDQAEINWEINYQLIDGNGEVLVYRLVLTIKPS